MSYKPRWRASCDCGWRADFYDKHDADGSADVHQGLMKHYKHEDGHNVTVTRIEGE